MAEQKFSWAIRSELRIEWLFENLLLLMKSFHHLVVIKTLHPTLTVTEWNRDTCKQNTLSRYLILTAFAKMCACLIGTSLKEMFP